MKTDLQRLSQNMICAGPGRLVILWHWLQVAMAPEASQVQQAQNCPRALPKPQLVSQGCCSLSCCCRLPGCWDMLRTWLWTALCRSSSSEHCCCYTFSQTCPGEHHTMELLTHLLATGRTCCRTTITKLQIKPQGRWKDVRKRHLILFLLKMKVSSQFFIKYGNLVTLQGKHK